jgi:SprT protein
MSATLESKLPATTWPLVSEWLAPFPCSVLMTRPRKTKIGDFRPARPNRPTTITLNRDLAPYQMLLTLTHEIAHLINWSQNGRMVAAHGPEWRAFFSELLLTLSETSALDPRFCAAIQNHAKRPRSSALYDEALYRVLRQLENSKQTVLGDLPEGAGFLFRKRAFTKISSQRSRCVCRAEDTGARYRIAKLAPVAPHPERKKTE